MISFIFELLQEFETEMESKFLVKALCDTYRATYLNVSRPWLVIFIVGMQNVYDSDKTQQCITNWNSFFTTCRGSIIRE